MSQHQHHLPANVKELITNPADIALLVDFDGTLVHFAAHPDKVHVPGDLIANIKKITDQSDMAFALVTGRSLGKLDALMQGVTTIALGSHGAEWRPGPGAEIVTLAPPIPLDVRHVLHAVALRHNCIFEDKIYTISMHLPFEEADYDLVPELADATAKEDETFVIRKVGRTYEILQKSVNKGFGIRHLMQQPGFKGKRPIYIGDDVEDDKSLAAVDQMGGLRLGVSSGEAIYQEDVDNSFMAIEVARLIVESLAKRPISAG